MPIQADSGKTSTFVIHHDKCDPSKWTIAEWKLLADFIKSGSLQYAAGLARRGMQLKLDDRLQPSGGDIEEIGCALGNKGDFDFDTFSDMLSEVVDDDLEVVEYVPIFRGQTRYAVRFFIGDDYGNIEGSEIETFETEEEAQRFLKSILGETHSNGERNHPSESK